VQREGRGLEQRGQHDQGDGRVTGRPGAILRDEGGERRGIGRAERQGQQQRGQQQGRVTAVPDQRELGSGAARLGAVGVEQQQPFQAQPHGDGGPGHHPEVARLDEDEHRRQHRQHQPVKGALAWLAVHVAAGIAHHDPADETHKQGQRQADRLGPQGAMARPLQDKLHQPRRGQRQRAQRRRFGQARQRAGAWPGPAQGQCGRGQQDERGEKGQREGGYHGLPPDRLPCSDLAAGGDT
jgi:hypothetical protein